RVLMIYLVTRFFRRPANVNPTETRTVPIDSSLLTTTYIPGSLYTTGDLLDMYIFISEEKLYRYDPMRKPLWKLNDFKYGDWSSHGTRTKFVEFPISEVYIVMREDYIVI
ncbi:unnamed protein product, partial [Rotaria magnacalcarata]